MKKSLIALISLMLAGVSLPVGAFVGYDKRTDSRLENRAKVGRIVWQQQEVVDARALSAAPVPAGEASVFFVREANKDKATSLTIAINNHFQTSLQVGGFSQVNACAGVNEFGLKIIGRDGELANYTKRFLLRSGATYFFFVEVDDEGNANITPMSHDYALEYIEEHDIWQQTHQISRAKYQTCAPNAAVQAGDEFGEVALDDQIAGHDNAIHDTLNAATSTKTHGANAQSTAPTPSMPATVRPIIDRPTTIDELPENWFEIVMARSGANAIGVAYDGQVVGDMLVVEVPSQKAADTPPMSTEAIAQETTKEDHTFASVDGGATEYAQSAPEAVLQDVDASLNQELPQMVNQEISQGLQDISQETPQETITGPTQEPNLVFDEMPNTDEVSSPLGVIQEAYGQEVSSQAVSDNEEAPQSTSTHNEPLQETPNTQTTPINKPLKPILDTLKKRLRQSITSQP